MTNTTAPPGSTKECASCGKPRGNIRVGWTPIVRGDEIIGFTCDACPMWVEPIRRVETRPGRVKFRARVNSTKLAHGRTRQQASGSFDTLEAARAWVAEVRSAVDAEGTYDPSITGETVEQLCDRWLTTRIDVRRVTRDGYAGSLAAVRRHPIASRPVTEVTIAEVQQLIDWLTREGGRPRRGRDVGTPLAVNSIKSFKVALQQPFDMALVEGRITRNPVKLARWPKARTKRGRDLDHWQPAELLKFREHADSDPLAGAWRLTLSGMTRADIMGLRWDDVDLEGGVASVSQGRVALNSGGSAVDDPKSAQRVRAIPFEAIHPGTIALLRRLKAKQAADRLAVGGAWRDSGLLAVDEVGDGLAPQVFSDRFRRLCVTAGVRVINLHSVRHSIAFWLHQIGVAPADAAALLGHSVEVHLSTYLPHSGAAGIQAAARALGAAAQQAVASEG
jgi:integrase